MISAILAISLVNLLLQVVAVAQRHTSIQEQRRANGTVFLAGEEGRNGAPMVANNERRS